MSNFDKLGLFFYLLTYINLYIQHVHKYLGNWKTNEKGEYLPPKWYVSCWKCLLFLYFLPMVLLYRFGFLIKNKAHAYMNRIAG